MQYKRFIRLFFLIPFILIFLILSISLVVDPYNLTNYNILNIKHKMARDSRTEKINAIKKIPNINNLILGSSRAQSLNPKYMTQTFGGQSYNFGVGNATIEDSLGLLLYLEKTNNLPKNILLSLDFSSFNTSFLLHESFLKLPELNFLNQKMAVPDNIIAKLLSIEAIRATFKTLKYHIKKREPSTYFDENGYLVSTEKIKADKNAIKSKIAETAQKYYKFIYNSGEFTVSKSRLNHLKQFIDLCNKNSINLIVTLSPVHTYQLELINKNQRLKSVLQDFKKQLLELTSFRDFMIKSAYTNNNIYFRDSVHFLDNFADIYMKDILNNSKSNIFIFRENNKF